MTTLLLVLLPLFLAASLTFATASLRLILMYLFGLLHHLLVVLLYFGWIPLTSEPYLGLKISQLGMTFLLGYTGLQLVSILALPKKEATVPMLLGITLLSIGTVLTIVAADPLLFVSAFIATLFVPYVCSYLQNRDWRGTSVFLFLAIITSVLVLIGAHDAFQNGDYRLNIWLLVAGMLRLGLVPFHLWVRRIVIKFPLQWSILFFLSYPSVALFIPLHHPITTNSINPLFMHLAWASALYGSALACIQSDIKRSLYYLLVSLFGSIALGFSVSSSSSAFSGVLLFWMSSGLSFAGFGLVIQLLESRFGQITFSSHHGLIEQVPKLGTLFLLFGLASIGFPGMCVFIGEEVMLNGIFEHSGWASIPILLALSLNGVTILKWFFSIFYGASTIYAGEMELLRRERLAFLVLLAIIIGTGLYPEPLFELGNIASETIQPIAVSHVSLE